MRKFFDNISGTWKVVSAIVGFIALGIAIFSAGFGARGSVDTAVNVPGQLATIQATQEQGFEEVQDSIASVRVGQAAMAETVRDHELRLDLAERMDCSRSAIETHGLERRVDCRTLERLREIMASD